MMPGVGDNAWGQETRGPRANHHLSHHLSAGTTGRDEVVPHVTAKGEGHRAEFWGGGNICRRPSLTNTEPQHISPTSIPQKAHAKTCLPPPNMGCCSRSCPLGAPRFFPLPPHPSLAVPALGAPLPGDGHGLEAGVPLGDGFLDGGTLGAHPQAVAGVLHVAPCGEAAGTRSATLNPAAFPPGDFLGGEGICIEKPYSVCTAQSQALASAFPASPIYFPYFPIRRELWLAAAGAGGTSTPCRPRCTPTHGHRVAWGAPKPKVGGVVQPRLTSEDLPAGRKQRSAHWEAAVGAIGAVFGLPAAAQQELQALTLGLARGDSGDRVLPATLHACTRLPCPLTLQLNISSPGK